MAYCTNCGASMEGAYCSQCGRPAGEAAPVSSATVPPRRKTSVLVWILVVVLGMALVAGLAAFAGSYWLMHKAREAGVDPELFRDNPGLAIAKLIAATHPDDEIVNTDTRAGTVTLRDRKTGREMTFTFDQVKKGNFRFEAEDHGKHAAVEFGGGADRVPAEVPVYPGAKVSATYEVDGDGDKGLGAYEYEFNTPDTPSKVVDYYHHRLEDDGMNVVLNTHTADGGMLVGEDDANHRTLRVIVSRDANGTTINLTARVKN